MKNLTNHGGLGVWDEVKMRTKIPHDRENISSCSHWIALFAMVFLVLALTNPNLGAQSSAARIMALGDSITYGFNGINYPNGSIPGGYRKQLGTRLSGAGYAYDFVGSSTANAAVGMDPHHNGYNGFRTDQILAKLPAWLAASPDIVLMHLGTNDLIQHVPLATAVKNLNSLIQQITVNAPNRRLFVATIIPIIDTRDGYTAAQWAGVIASYNTQVRGLVVQHANQGRKVTLVEMNANLVYTATNPENRFFQPGDGTHPGQSGYNQMGDFWFDAIRSAGITPPPPPPVLPTLLINGGFESDYAGWTRSGNHSVQPTAPYAGTSGAKLVNFNGGNLAPNGVLTQTFQTTAGAVHTLTFDAGVIAHTTQTQVLHVSVTGTTGLLSESVHLTGLGNGATRWSSRSFTFTADSAATTLVFRDRSVTTIAIDLLLDKVRVTGSGVTPTNTAPVAVADSHATHRDTSLVISVPGLLVNDSDAQSHPLTATLIAEPGRGSVSLNANGGFTYVPAAGHVGVDSFTYRASDGSLHSNVATVIITIHAVTAGMLVNGSFESGISGWTATGNQAIASGPPYAATHGSKLVAFNGGNRMPNATVSQSFATVAGQSYSLAFDVGVFSFNTRPQTLLLTINGTGALLTRSITIFGMAGGSNHWLPQSFGFTADSATTTLAFSDRSTTTESLDLLLDNVRVQSTASAASFASASDPSPSSPGTLSLTGSPGDFTITLTATVSGAYFLECSHDLSVWERIGEMRVTAPGLIRFRDERIPGHAIPQRSGTFYRVAIHADSVGN